MLYPAFQDYLDGVYSLTYIYGREALRVVRDDEAGTFGMEAGKDRVNMSSDDLGRAWCRAFSRPAVLEADLDLVGAWFHDQLRQVIDQAEAHAHWVLLTGGFGVLGEA